MSRFKLLVLAMVSWFLAGCASAPPAIPSPRDPESAGIGIDLRVRISGMATYRADLVYFIKRCQTPDEKCDDKLIASNYAKEGRVYLLNVEPGEYRAVAVAFESGVLGDHNLYYAYFPEALTAIATARVRPRSLAYAGSHLVSAYIGLCPDNAEVNQLKLAEMVEPGTPKCGFTKMLLHKIGTGDYVFLGGNAYLVGRQTYHYRGTTYESDGKAKLSTFLENARNDLGGAGWSIGQ